MGDVVQLQLAVWSYAYIICDVFVYMVVFCISYMLLNLGTLPKTFGFIY